MKALILLLAVFGIIALFIWLVLCGLVDTCAKVTAIKEYVKEKEEEIRNDINER